MGDPSDDKFLSEVHIDFHSFPLNEEESIFVTRIPLISEEANCDDDEEDISSRITAEDSDDIEVPRKKFKTDTKSNQNVKTINHLSFIHHQTTKLTDVGKQLWKGSLILADFILSNNMFEQAYCVELGCGIGLCSSLLVSKAAHVICTDKSDDILSLCERNIQENGDIVALVRNSYCKNGPNLKTKFSCQTVNWFDYDSIEPFDLTLNNNKQTTSRRKYSKYSWDAQTVSILRKTNIILAADCIYDDQLTDALLNTILSLCISSEEENVTILLSVEKRINFTLDDLDISAPAHEYFIKQLKKIHNKVSRNSRNQRKFEYCKLPLIFKQSINYIRNQYLELWQINCGLKSFNKVKPSCTN